MSTFRCCFRIMSEYCVNAFGIFLECFLIVALFECCWSVASKFWMIGESVFCICLYFSKLLQFFCMLSGCHLIAFSMLCQGELSTFCFLVFEYVASAFPSLPKRFLNFASTLELFLYASQCLFNDF